MKEFETFLIREHEYISSSLMRNREKGVQRFTIYISLIAAIAVIIGLKEGNIDRINFGIVLLMFGFIMMFGFLLLLTLVRRSIITEQHFLALRRARHILASREIALFLVPDNDGESYEFEQSKIKYLKEKSTRKIQALYGDLLENICAMNAFVAGCFITWLANTRWTSHEPLWLAVVTFLMAMCWIWSLQMIFVNYKHRSELLGDEPRGYLIVEFVFIFLVGIVLLILLWNFTPDKSVSV